MSERLSFLLNGRAVDLDIDGTKPLLAVLREDLELRGTRFGCGAEKCGACMVLIDGTPEYACGREVAAVAGRAVVTVEGLADGDTLHPLQQALLDEQAGQCGYCLSGIIVSGAALLEKNKRPGRAEIVAALDPHLCRCGIHNRVVRAVQKAGAAMAQGVAQDMAGGAPA